MSAARATTNTTTPAAALLWLLLLFRPITTTLAANLRGGEDDDELVNLHQQGVELSPEQHHRRMQAIASYWKDHIDDAIPRDILLPKKASRGPSRALAAFELDDDDDNEGSEQLETGRRSISNVVPRSMENPDQYVIKLGEKYVTCTVTYQPFAVLEDDEDEFGRRRHLAKPKSTSILPKGGAIETSDMVDFVIDIFDKDNDIEKITLTLNDLKTQPSRSRFNPTQGNGRYTFQIGPLDDGKYEWNIKVKDKKNTKNKSKFRSFTVKASPGQGPPRTRPTPPPPSDSGKPQFKYYSPLSGVQSDPVTFDWKVTGASISTVLLFIEYPDGTQGYMSRNPVGGNGRDSIEAKLDESGNFRWSIWVQVNGGPFEAGPWQAFSIAGSSTNDGACTEKLGRYTARHQDLHKAVGRIMFRFGDNNFLCSGTLVEGANDRAVIATAAHCIFDSKTNSFPSYVMVCA